MLSHLSWLKVILLSGGHCISNSDGRPLKCFQKGLRMRHVLEEEERRKMEPDLVPSVDRSNRSNTRDSADPYALLTAGLTIFNFFGFLF